MEARELNEQLLILKQELLSRRGDDPLYQWQPLPKQKPFVESVLYNKVSENWFLAANNSGKSAAGAYIGSCLARFGGDPRPAYSSGGRIEVKDRATAGLVSSLTNKMSQNVIEPKYFDNGYLVPGEAPPFIPKREIEHWNSTDRTLRLKSGSLIYFLTADAGRKKYQGLKVDWAHLDEEHEKPIYDELSFRAGRYKLKLFGTATLLPPEGMVGGVSWMFKEIIVPFMQGKSPDIACYGASIYDNPYADPAQIRLLEAKYPVGSLQRRIRIDGEWLPGIGGARAYPAFDQRIHVRKQEPPFPRRPLCWCMDFNVEPMVSLVGQRDGRIFRVFRELIMDEGYTQEMAEYFVSAFPHHPAEIWIYGDSTGRGRRSVGSPQVGTSDYQIIMNVMRRYGSPIRLKVPEENPFVRDRINAVNRSLKDEHGEICVEIDPSCEELITDLEQVLADNRGGVKKTSNKNDPYFRRTHTSDAFGYWISYEEPVRALTLGQKIMTLIQPPSYSWSA